MSASVPDSPFWSGMARSRGRNGPWTPVADPGGFTPTSPATRSKPPSRPENAQVMHLPPGAAEGASEMSRIRTPRNASPEAAAKFRQDYGAGRPIRRIG